MHCVIAFGADLAYSAQERVSKGDWHVTDALRKSIYRERNLQRGHLKTLHVLLIILIRHLLFVNILFTTLGPTVRAASACKH